jgi:alpha-beta hydrolase superfamily lysophospholipase
MTETEMVTADGVHLRLRVRPTGTGAKAAIVIAHGFGASVADRRVAAVADALHGDGYTVVAYDARGHGASQGETTLGHSERYDVEAAAAVASSLSDRVVAFGVSMGAIATLRYGVGGSALAGIVILSCPARWKLPRNARGVLSALLVQTQAGRAYARSQMGVRIAGTRERGDEPVELVGLLRVPLAIVHGRADPFIPATDAGLLYARAHEPRRLLISERLRHAFDPVSLAIPAVRESIAWVLAAAG